MGPVCSVPQTAGSPSARTLRPKTSTPALLGSTGSFPPALTRDRGARMGAPTLGGGQGPRDLPTRLLLHRSGRPRAPGARASRGQGLGARVSSMGRCWGTRAECRSCGRRPSCSWEKPGPASGQGQTGHGETTGRCRMCRGCSSACAATCDESGPHTSGPGPRPRVWLHVPVASAGLPLARTRVPQGLRGLWKGQPKLEQIYSPL